MDRELIKILQVNKKLETRDEIKQFRVALKELKQQDLDDSLLSELLLAFDDHAHNIEILEGLINLVFQFNSQTIASTLTRMTEELYVLAPIWLRLIYTRTLHDDDARFYIRQNFSSLTSSNQQAIRNVLISIATRTDRFEDPEISKDMQSKVGSILKFL